MSEAAAQPEGVEAPIEGAAPVEGQGAESQGNDLYGQFLEGVSPDIHEQVIPALKAQDAEFTKRFQSLSEKTKPFEDAGLLDSDPETAGQYLSLANAIDAAQNGDTDSAAAVYEWWDGVGEQLGFYEAGEDSEGAEDGESGDLPEDFDPYDADQLSSLLEKRVGEQIQPILDALEAQQAQSETQEIMSRLEEQAVSLQSEHDLSDEVMDEVLELAGMYGDSDNPIQAGYEKYKSLTGRGEGELLQKKLEQPAATPEGSGPGNTAPEKITSENVKDIFRQRLEQANSI